MSFLRGSTNHVWCTTSVLGKGATGAVYQGVNKINGEPVAVKTFNELSQTRPHEVKMREFEVLKKVKHKNIVKLLAIEEEQQENRGKVIVMELCTGGSLFNILDDPENTYGLQESEFLLVLDHLSAGMKHLRDNNLVHRDLKPGNIMKFICEDGSTVYKLTDFGAARELQEGQQFNSLYGTEEYLHPDMYERAVLRRMPDKTFGATVDLWSIGVTLYHVATGNLPFRPYGGRRNKETMYLITTKKESGVISGIQTEDKGPIEWSRNLPNNCQLSAGLKKIITPLLAGLLEADQKRIWSFEKFFNEVRNILSRKILTIFYVNRVSFIKVYISPDETYDQLQNHIVEQTAITSENQILVYKDSLFAETINENNTAGGYPQSSFNEPLLLFSKENNNIAINIFTEVPRFPEFTNLVSVENDAVQAKTCCSLGYVCKRRIEIISQCCHAIKYAVSCYIKFIKSKLCALEAKSVHLKEMTLNQELTSKIFHLSETTINNLTTDDNKFKIINFPEEINKISDEFLTDTYPKVHHVYKKNITDDMLLLEWESSTKVIQNLMDTKAAARAKTLVERLRDSWQQLVRDKATRTLTYNDEQFHVLERIKISETSRRIKQILDLECMPAYNQLAEVLEDWYKIAQTLFLQVMILNKDVNTFENKLDTFSQNLSIYSRQYIEETQNILEQSKNLPKVQQTTNNGGLNRKLKYIFKEFENEKIKISDLIGENQELLKEVNNFFANKSKLNLEEQ